MTQETKQTRPKVLLVDDDPVLLDTYSELLRGLPSHPEVSTATSGSRALTLLKNEHFRLLICDLGMPKMDGLQVLTIVRRQWPEMRTVMITGVQDEHFRSRAYALGVDMFWQKPDSGQNVEMFLQCVESLLGRESEVGFRGVQNKGLMDLVQMESLSQSSSVLKVMRGSLEGRIWFQSGELIDSETDGLRGEAAFQRILSWKSGAFEHLAPEPDRERTILKPLNALLLETAQVLDEIAAPTTDLSPEESESADHRKNVMRLAALTHERVNFMVSIPDGKEASPEAWGVEDPGDIARWAKQACEACQRLSQQLKAGPTSHIEARSLDHRILVLAQDGKTFVTGWPLDTERSRLKDQTVKLISSWDS